MLLAASAHPWYAISWVDWIGVTGLPLALVGLAVTWRQAKQAADSAMAAKNAVYRTEQQVRASQVMVLVPQLRWTVAELETAIEKDSPLLARRQLDNWRWQAGNIHGMLIGNDSSERSILRSITQSVGLAASAGGLLLENNGTVSSRCLKARGAMAATCDELASWVGRHATQGVHDEGEVA